MKKSKLLAIIPAILLVFSLSACKKEAEKKIIVGATSVPHAEMLAQITDDLKAKGITLEIKEFSDYKMLNPALNDKQIDANFFQHHPYLADYCENSGHKLVSIGNVHIEPMGIYSKNLISLDDLQDGAIVAIPNDTTNEARALILLEAQGLIKLSPDAGFAAMPEDIIENPKNLEFKELEAAQLPRTLEDTDISVINTNYAMEAGLNPINDALAMEDKDSPYANVIAVRDGDQNKTELQELYKAMTSDKIKTYLSEKYGDAIVPAF